MSLIGSGYKVGEYLGQKLAVFLKNSAAWANIDIERIKLFKRIVVEVAPWWLDETEGIGNAAEIPVEVILMANCRELKPDRYYMGGCTSFLIMGDRSATTFPLLMKIRDEKPLPQIAGVKGIVGTNRYVFGTNVGNIGIAHFLNEKGLAGANNTGSPVLQGIKDIGLNDCHIMRLIAEKADNCRQAYDILNSLMRKGYVGNAGFRRGMIFLFADAQEGLLVENTADSLAYRFLEHGQYVYTNHFLLPEMQKQIDIKRIDEVPAKSSRVRWQRGWELLKGIGVRKVTVNDLSNFSRDTKNRPYSLCNTTDAFPWKTISASIHSLHPGSFHTLIANTAPSLTEYIRVIPADKILILPQAENTNLRGAL